MAMAERTVPTINLLPQKGESFVTQLLNWTLSVGRLLIILVEMVALGTFLMRFDLDMKIVDLHDKIEAQSFIVANFQKSEENFRDIQDRLALVERYDAIGTTTTNIFSDITKLGQGKVTFKNLTIEPENAKIEMQASSTEILSQFVAALRAHPSVTGVIVDKVENSTSTSRINVSITASLKQSAFDKTDQTNDPTVGAPIPALGE
ncbi:MAG: hypothetical protein H0W89_01845 [Candidatus Levybacteria bacterium]|nr:hypothetical protein [Candidatus Levybacteria bacterium]